MIIENILSEFKITDAAIAELSAEYMPLRINGINDKAGALTVTGARKVIKNYRIQVEKKRKELTADALEAQRRINGEAKRIIALLEPIEEHLINEEQKVLDELERIKREKEEAELARLQSRSRKLMSIDFKFDGVKYITDYLDSFCDRRIEIAVLHLKQIDDKAFDDFFENANHYFQIHQKEKIIQERLRQEALAKEDAERKAESERLAQERERLEVIAKEQAEREARFKASVLDIAPKPATEQQRVEDQIKFPEYFPQTPEEKIAYQQGINFAIAVVMTTIDIVHEETAYSDRKQIVLNVKEAIEAELNYLKNEKII